MKVLYVEDHEPTVFLLRDKYGALQIESAGSLTAAKARLLLDHFDILLVDLNLPDSKGMNTVRELINYEIPLVVLTADTSSEFHAEAWRLGVADYIQKKHLFDVDIAAKLQDAHGNYERIKRRYATVSYGNFDAVKRYISCPPFAVSPARAGQLVA